MSGREERIAMQVDARPVGGGWTTIEIVGA